MSYLINKKNTLFTSSILAAALAVSGISHAAESQNSSAVITPTSTSNTLPNAFELVKKIDGQNREIARLAGEFESLQMQMTALKQQLKSELKQELMVELERNIQAKTKSEVDSAIAKIDNPTTTAQRPYLVPPSRSETGVQLATKENPINQIRSFDNSSLAIPKANPLTRGPDKQEGEMAYAAAYSALKNEGVDVGIQKMQTFIATYANHSLIPNAHYWLGEFYLKQTPPNVALAREQFVKVITNYKDHPSNDKQSKALYRLATFAKNSGDSVQAQQYANTLIKGYPKTAEAKLAKSIKW